MAKGANEEMSNVGLATSYALARLRARPAQSGVATVAVGVAVSALAIMVVLPVIGGDLLLRRTLRTMPAAERTVTVLLAPESRPSADVMVAVDTQLRSKLALESLGPLRRLLEYRDLKTADGALFRLAGIENITSGFVLAEGHLPGSCLPTRCEVVTVGASAAIGLGTHPTPSLTVVGRVIQTDPVPFSGTLAPGSAEVILLGDGIESVNQVAELTLVRRVDAWVTTIEPAEISRPTLARLQARLPEVGATMAIPGITVIAPDVALAAAVARADIGSRGLALPLAQTGVLLLGLVVIVALGLRDRHVQAADRLARRGADRSMLGWYDALSSLFSIGIGLVGGTVVGVVASALILRRLGLVVPATLRLAWRLPQIAAFGTVLIVLWLVTTFLMRYRGLPSLAVSRRVYPSDVVLLGTLAVLALTLSRGVAGTSSDGTDPVLWVLPFLLAIVLICIVVRIVPLLLAGFGRLIPARLALGRVAVLDAVRRPLRPFATASLVAIALSFGVFGLSYRSTLFQGASEQAAFVVPYDFRLDAGAELLRPAETAPAAGWQQLVPGTQSTNVVRRGVTLRRSGTIGDAVEMLGLDPSGLGSLRSARDDYDPTRSSLATLLAASPPSPLGSSLPGDATVLRIQTNGSLAGVEVDAVIESKDGRWSETVAVPDTSGKLEIALEPGARGGRLVGFRVGQPAYDSARAEHAIGEGDHFITATPVAIDLVAVSTVANGGRDEPVAFDLASLTSAQARLSPTTAGGVHVDVALQGTAALLVPTASSAPLLALTDPLTASAAQNGVVTVDASGAALQLRVIGVASRFPTLGERFIVTDAAQMQRRLNLAQPGAGSTSEVWLAADSASHEQALAVTLRQAPYSRLSVDRRVERAEALRQDPLSRLSLGVLVVSSMLAVLLAAGALALNAVAERSEDEAFHRALALEGATDRVIRRLVRIRSMALAAAGVPVGLLGGAFLLSIIVRVVNVSATGVTPQPPLRRVVPWGLLGGSLAGVLLVLAAAAWLASGLARPLVRQDLLRGRS